LALGARSDSGTAFAAREDLAGEVEPVLELLEFAPVAAKVKQRSTLMIIAVVVALAAASIDWR